MVEIQLTQNKIALIDEIDFELVSPYTWCYSRTKNGTDAAVTNVHKAGGGKTTLKMHRLIMGVTNPKIKVDHINHNQLDNRRENLRLATHQQNNQNRRKTRGTSKYKGVLWLKRGRRWRAVIGVNGNIVLGSFIHEVDAALAYNEAAKKYFGEFALLNIIELDEN